MKRITLVLLAVVLGVCLIPNTSAQEGTVDGATPITNCMTITQPGSYLVVRNITLTASNAQTVASIGLPACIVIGANFVTLDLGGHTLSGPPGGYLNGSGAFGIVGNNGMEVRSGVVTSFYDGIAYGSGLYENIRAFNNVSVGIDVAPGSRVVGNIAVNNGSSGINVICPSVVVGNAAYGNGAHQIFEGPGGCTNSDNSPAP